MDAYYEAVQSSQHCQRNWDLSKQIPQAHKDVILYSASECPSKQNIAFYRIHAIEDRELQEKIYNITESVPGNKKYNAQVLANWLLVFQEIKTSNRYNRIVSMTSKKTIGKGTPWNLENPEQGLTQQFINRRRDVNLSIGIASGYANLTANQLGYKTGYCACFNDLELTQLLGLDEKEPVVLTLGIGFPQQDKQWFEEHYPVSENRWTYDKEVIDIIHK